MWRCLLNRVLDRTRFFCRRYSRDTLADGKMDRDSVLLEKRPPKRPKYPEAKYGGDHLATLIMTDEKHSRMGDYIEAIFDHMHVPVMFEKIYTSNHIHKTGEDSDFCEIVVGIERTGIALIYDLQADNEIRFMGNMLDLYAAVVNVMSYPTDISKNPKVDVLFILQNNWGDYTKLEYEPVTGVVETLSITIANEIDRFLMYAFNYAANSSRKKVTFGHKLIEQPLKDGLLLRKAREISQMFSDIEFEILEIGDLSEKLVRDPHHFDVICLNQNYGNPLVAIACGICGASSLASAANYGDNIATFQPILGKLSIENGDLNPFGAISAAVHLLVHLGYRSYGQKLWKTLTDVTFNKKIMTKDIGGSASPEEVVCNIIKNL